MNQDLRANKSALAKLLAGENINIVHQKIPTAAFDLKTRTLYCPIWEVIDGDLYDLLMGHEVGHSLFTPSEGWHSAIDGGSSNISDVNKSVLNVCEDARIEKLMKRKYPGLSRPMFRAYKELHNRDFFGIKDLKDFSKLNLADRLNVHFKFGALNHIPFSEEEMEIVKALDEVETFDEVVDIARRVSSIMGKNKTETDQIDSIEDLRNEIKKQNQEQQEDGLDEELDYQFGDSGEEGEEQDQDDDFDSNDYDDDQQDGAQSFDSSDEDEEEESTASDKMLDELGDTVSEDDSITDAIFRAREKELVVDGLQIHNCNFPEPILSNIIEPIDKILERFKPFYEQRTFDVALRNKQNAQRFSRNNDKYIQLLVKQFLMKRNASQYARQLTAKTGELDMGKLHSYRFTNDIFAKMTVVPKGKSHGIVMFVDLSGSMNRILPQTVEQLLILSTFCKRVNLPFDIYGFNDGGHHTRKGDKFVSGDNLYVGNSEWPNAANNFHLKHILSSSFSNSVYSQAVKMLLNIAYPHSRSNNPIYYAFELNSTPLIATIAVSREIIEQFKNKYRLDVVNAIYLTDGEETDSFFLKNEKGFGERITYTKYDSYIKEILRITDRKSRSVMNFTRGDNLRTDLLKFIRKITGSNNIGFYIGYGYAIRNRLRDLTEDEKQQQKLSLKNNGFFTTQEEGFDAYFNVAINDDMTQESVLTTDVNELNKKVVNSLAKEFGKNQAKKKSDRIFTTALMDYVC
jgi:hypothetical protein